MRFEPLPLDGAFVVHPEPNVDQRGFFARIWASGEFARQGLAPRLAECSLSLSPKRGTLRGLHYQVSPHEESKLVTCVRGTIWDVIVDLRPESHSYRQWHATWLDGNELLALYVPEGFAHGFLTVSDDVLVLYQISAPHHPESARGIRWDDPAIAIEWPERPSIASERDLRFEDFA